MKVIEVVKSLLPDGTDGSLFREDSQGYVPARNNVDRCPIWPPDIFAVTGTLIERSSCYTEAGPDRINPKGHSAYINDVTTIVAAWVGSDDGLFAVPEVVQNLWTTVVRTYGETAITGVMDSPELVKALLLLFALADEACRGMGWDNVAGENVFADLALASFVNDANVSESVPLLPYSPNSLCALVPPSAAVVMPKTLTATVGCTIRSLSHHLALLPGISQCRPSWALTNEEEEDKAYKPIRLLVIPYPFSIPSDSFSITDDPVHLVDGTFTAAYFGLEQKWLKNGKTKTISAKALFDNLVKPLLDQANGKSPSPVTGIVMPECSLSEHLADALAKLLGKADVSFFTTGILSRDANSGKSRNVAKTYVLHKEKPPHCLEQFKHHRWRLDRAQCEQYGLDFHRLSRAEKWWEDIDVSNRQLPFLALRRYMSMTVLICEDLARNDPAMSVVRAVGPNLVIALLMDGPQLNHRWPGKYATVLGEDPGSGVLSVTCSAMLDRSNDHWNERPKKRVIGLWRGEGSSGTEIELPKNHHGVLLDIHSRLVEQHTLDTRPDAFGSRKLSLSRQTPLKLASPPRWL